MKMRISGEKIRAWLEKYKLALLVLAAGVVLLLWPANSGTPGEARRESAPAGAGFDLAQTEEKLEKVLSRVEGAGEVSVALTVKDGGELLLATDTTRKGDGAEEQVETVIISTGSGTEEAVTIGERWPVFQGAVVVCQGGGDPEVRLLVTRAVCALTGLGADKVTVCKGAAE